MSDTSDSLGMVPWRYGPGEPRRKTVPILSPKPGQTVRGIILDAQLLRVMTHWYDRRTHACLSPRTMCEGCHRRAARLEKAYLGVVQCPRPYLGMVEITMGAIAEIGPSAFTPAGGLRGWYIAASRPCGKPQGRVSVRLSAVPKEYRHIVLPEPFDTREELLAIWQAGYERPALDAAGKDDGEEVPL